VEDEDASSVASFVASDDAVEDEDASSVAFAGGV
jgi:hypothetical protein